MDNHKKTKSTHLFIQLKFLSLSFNMCARKIHRESLVFVCDPGFLSNVCAGPASSAYGNTGYGVSSPGILNLKFFAYKPTYPIFRLRGPI